MKKLLIAFLSMTVAGAAFAESEIDRGLKKFGIVDQISEYLVPESDIR